MTAHQLEPAPAVPQADDAVQRDDARVAYQVAASLMISEGNLIWARFGAMLVTHSIIVAAIGLTASSTDSIRKVAWGTLPIAGLLLCVVWVLINQRGYTYYAYWILSMRELEEVYLSPAARTISRGAGLSAGKTIELTIDGKRLAYRMHGLSRLPIAWSSYGIISIFLLLYLGTIIAFVVGM